MKKNTVNLSLLLSLLVSAAAASTNSPVVTHASLELRDGSKVVGVFADKTLPLTSASLGEFKLPVERIRALDWLTDKTLAALSATNGDKFTVELRLTDLPLASSFGDIKVPVTKIRSLRFWTDNGETPRLPGLVALWSGEGDARDAVSGQTATVIGGLSYVPGKVGQSFSFNGVDAAVKITASSSLNVGLGNGFTIATWINPSDVSAQRPLIEWNSGGYGVQLWMGVGGSGLFFNVVDSGSGTHHVIYTPAGTITKNTFQHIAATYDKTTGVAALFINGAQATQANVGIVTPATAMDVYLGYRPVGASAGSLFVGQIDELGIYNRDLSADEIRQLFDSGN